MKRLWLNNLVLWLATCAGAWASSAVPFTPSTLSYAPKREPPPIRLHLRSTNDALNQEILSDISVVVAANNASMIAIRSAGEPYKFKWQQREPAEQAYYWLNLGIAGGNRLDLRNNQLLYRFSEDCMREVLRLADQITPFLEYCAVDSLANQVDASDLAATDGHEVWQELRRTKADWWLHCWQRLAQEANSVDGEHPRPSEAALVPAPPPPVDGTMTEAEFNAMRAKIYSEVEQMTRASEAVDLAAVAKRSVQGFLVPAYSKQPFASHELHSLLIGRLGDRHPAVRRILTQVSEKLPPEPKRELDAILARLPPAGTPAQIQAAWKASADAAKLNAEASAKARIADRAAKRAILVADNSQSAATGLSSHHTGGNKVHGGPVAVSSGASGGSSFWRYVLAGGAGVLIIGTLWRAQARANPRQSK